MVKSNIWWMKHVFASFNNNKDDENWIIQDKIDDKDSDKNELCF